MNEEQAKRAKLMRAALIVCACAITEETAVAYWNLFCKTISDLSTVMPEDTLIRHMAGIRQGMNITDVSREISLELTAEAVEACYGLGVEEP